MEAEVSHLGWLGFIPFTIVIGSLFFIILSSILVKPWKPRVTGVFIGSVLILFVLFILGFWLGGKIFGIFIPSR